LEYQGFFLAIALLKENKQETSADQTLSGEFAPALSLDFKLLIIFKKSTKSLLLHRACCYIYFIKKPTHALLLNTLSHPHFNL
jgi:hypothetical protein